jgi:hypothetical protein
MSLLDTASLIVTPNAYKEGKLYSVIPSDGSGDFTFTRATTATRVNSSGLVELVPYNLLTYSEQFDNAAWVKQNGTITPNTIASPSGVSSADTFTDNSTNSLHGIVRFSQWSTTQQTFSIYVKPNTLTKFFIANGSTGNAVCFDLTTLTVEGYTNGSGNLMINPTITPMINGWIRLSATHTATASQTLSFGFYKVFNATSLGATVNYIGSGETAYLWGAQLVEGSVAKDYQKTETRLNIPRLDYSLGGCPNILLEPQRTNLVTYSEQFDDASWNKINSSVTANADISPDGYTNADRIYDNATSGQHRVGKNISVVSATTYTFSVFAKKGSLRYCYLFTVAGGASDRYYFDLQDGISITAGGKIEDYGSGWYRISAQVTAAATGNELFAFNLTDSPSSPTYLGTGTGYHMIYGYQVEAGNYQTSYIPTTSASVTRNLETVAKTGATALIGQTEGTIFLECAIPNQGSASRRLFSLSDGTTNNAILIQNVSNSTLIQFVVVNGGVIDVAITVTSAFTFGQMFKVAVAYANNDFVIYINGVQGGTDNIGTVPTTSKIAFDRGNDTTHFEGFMKTAVIWKERLTNDQLAQLTTI